VAFTTRLAICEIHCSTYELCRIRSTANTEDKNGISREFADLGLGANDG